MLATDFQDFGLSKDLSQAISNKGYQKPTPIQQKVIPLILNEDCDIVAQSQTGTGKTAAFSIPIIEKLSSQHYPQVLVLTPTRELALQIAFEFRSLTKGQQLQTVCLYGGQPIAAQLRFLKKGPAIVIGTPGRLLDHLKRRTLNLKHLKFVVLDEADEMLNMGFIDDVESILKFTPSQRRTLLFSATMPQAILDIARQHMSDYQFITTSQQQLALPLTTQLFYEVASNDKFKLLCHLLNKTTDFYGLIFCKTKREVNTLTEKLLEQNFNALKIHGDMSQSQRQRALKRFMNHQANILVATDVAARGLDINQLSHVINYALPQDIKFYLHRIGRTGRAGHQGVAVSFVTLNERRQFFLIKKKFNLSIKRLPLPWASTRSTRGITRHFA